MPNADLHPRLAEITDRIEKRSQDSRRAYEDKCKAMADDGPQRRKLSCSNLAHGFAACEGGDKQALKFADSANIGIVSAYNEMLSAHQPFENYPDIIKDACRKVGSTAQFAGGVPAMCDGVTQGTAGMELSLFSRDIIAAATAIALSHNMFDGALCLGVCDKIIPGLMIGSLSFGHLPVIMVPAGPMASGISNPEKARIRQQHAAGEIGDDALLEAESAAYHGRGTCTFYGTANSNQMLMEIMGMHVPGSAFIHPGHPLREQLTRAAAERVCKLTPQGGEYTPMYEVVTAKSIINALIGLMATGGSTNHALHWVTIARAAGVHIDWQDYADISAIIPLLARVYPNGTADVNHFHAAGGTAFIIRELLSAGLLHNEVKTVWGEGMAAYTQRLDENAETLQWQEPDTADDEHPIVRGVSKPFSTNGGLQLLKGNLGRSVIKISAVKGEHQIVEAPARVFHDQQSLKDAFEAGELDKDVVAVVRFQGPKANGMPELHKLTPYLGLLQDRGHKVALVTDGRMSGASGKVPSAIHLSPEAADGGAIARICDGDMVRLDARAGTLSVNVPDAEFAARNAATFTQPQEGLGRELFAALRGSVNGAEAGATIFFQD